MVHHIVVGIVRRQGAVFLIARRRNVTIFHQIGRLSLLARLVLLLIVVVGGEKKKNKKDKKF